jgi:hypothetical protein
MQLRDMLTDYPACTVGRSLADWDELAQSIVSSLGTALGMPLSITGKTSLPSDEEVHPGLCVSFESGSVGASGLLLRIEGVGGVQGSPGFATINASLFLFLHGHRVTVPGHDHFEMELHVADDGELEWRFGWQIDANWEFENIRKFGDCSR